MEQIIGERKHRDWCECSSALEVLKTCDAGERAPHMGRIVEMLKDKDWVVRSSALEERKTSDAGESVPHSGRIVAIMKEKVVVVCVFLLDVSASFGASV